MYIFLASGYRKRYLDEVVRSLSLPSGALITLRYDNQWISPKAKELVKRKIYGAKCLICYIQYVNEESEVIPVRFGKIADAEDAGSFTAINIAVDEYACVYDKNLFRESFYKKATGIPNSSSGGFFFTEFDENATIFGLSSGNNKKYWEKTVVELLGCPKFNEINYNFFRMDGIFRQKTWFGNSITSIFQKGNCILKSGQSYHIKICFFKSFSTKYDNQIVASSDNNIKFISPTKIPIDTSYDVRRISFKTAVVSFLTYGYINIDSNHGKSIGENFSGIDFDLSYKIEGNIVYNISVGLIFGLFLFLANFKGPSVTTSQPVEMTKLFFEYNWVRLLLSIIAGMVASFGIKKPFW